jgi:uncharacterized membrane protein YedE/YeeE
MAIDWLHFTPTASLAGGVLIGMAAALLVLANGRIAGISGILGGLLVPKRGDMSWRVAFLAGLIAAPAAWFVFAPLTAPRIDASVGTLLVAGVLVGVGTAYGSGCTSGHGVCGLARLSPRSAVATVAFMVTGVVTVFVVRHVVG